MRHFRLLLWSFRIDRAQDVTTTLIWSEAEEPEEPEEHATQSKAWAIPGALELIPVDSVRGFAATSDETVDVCGTAAKPVMPWSPTERCFASTQQVFAPVSETTLHSAA